MFRLLLILMLSFAAPVGAQDSEADEQTSAEASPGTTDADSEGEVDDGYLDETDLYRQAIEDDFIPSDEVSFEQSVPFPTDI